MPIMGALALKEELVDKTNEGRVYFSLDGDELEPDLITELLGIKPTKTSLKGSVIAGKMPTENSWELSTAQLVDEYIDIYEMSAQLISSLIPKRDLIIEAVNKFSARPRLQVVLTFSINEEHSTPAIGFDTTMIEFLAYIGAYIDVDTYRH